MADEVNSLDWLKCQIEIDKLQTGKIVEGLKIVHAHSKMLVTNLMLINIGGFTAMPVISAFMKLESVTPNQRVELFKEPAIAFGGGLVFSLFAGLCLYFNATNYVAQADWSKGLNISELWINHPNVINNEIFKDQLKKIADSAKEKANKYNRWVGFWQVAGVLSGSVSLASFIVACWLLFTIKLP